MADAERLAGALPQDGIDVEAYSLLGWFHWYRAMHLPQERETAAAAAVDYFSVCFALGAGSVPEELFDLVVEAATAVARAWLERAPQEAEFVPMALSAWGRIVDALPEGAPLRAMALSSLGVTHYQLYRLSGDWQDLDEAVAAARGAVDAVPADDPDLYFWATNLSGMLTKRFEVRGSWEDLDAGIAWADRAARLAPPGEPTRGHSLGNLCMALRIRFDHTGDLSDLEAAVDHGRAAVAALTGHLDVGTAMGNLCVALRKRFERLGARADLEEAHEVGEALVAAVPEGHPDRALALDSLGAVLMLRFKDLGETTALARAVELNRAAAAAHPPDSPDRASVLHNLATVLHVRSDRTGDLGDLDEAIATLRRAMTDTRPDATPHHQTANLSGFLRKRYERTGDRAALDEAITWSRATVAELPENHPDRPSALSNLGACLHTRYLHDGTRDDLEQAVATSRRAVMTTPADHVQRAIHLTVLANSLVTRFQLTGVTQDLDDAIDADRAALDAAARGSQLWATNLGKLAWHLSIKGRSSGDERVAQQAITCCWAALAATPPDDAAYAGRLADLAWMLTVRNANGDEDAARTLVLAALEQPVIRPSAWVETAALAAMLLLDHDRAKAAEVLEKAVLLLPEAASRRLARADQERALAAVAGLTSHAASLALSDVARAGRTPVERALGLLELGRGVLLGRALDTHDELADLRTTHPELATQFVDLRDRLDLRGDTEPDRHGAATQLATLTARIRALDGYTRFPAPPDTRELTRHADRGPIVVLNVSKYRADAILVRSCGVEVLPLPGLTFEPVRTQVVAFLQALAIAHAPDAPLTERVAAQDTLLDLLGWLWDAIVGPVLDALEYRRQPKGDRWPHVWWVPVGELSLMPLHAAGHHRHEPGTDGRPTALDRVVSSYTPTIRALVHAREADARPNPTGRALVVAMPTTPGSDQPLPHAAREAHLVSSFLPGATVLVDTPPTTEVVLEHLADSAVAHFACHSVADPQLPGRGRLLLHDHMDNPLMVADLMTARLANARLAYLSACDTAAVAATDLLDEATHLTTAFQLAGYPHVIGTLWKINDPLAADIAYTFYTNLQANGQLDPSRSATALHRAIRALRDKLPLTPSLWAAHIHAGA